MRRIVITGGAGFVGSNLAIRIKCEQDSVEVVAFDNLHRRGSELNLERLRSAGVKFIHGDIRNKEDFCELTPADILIECSAEPSVMAGYDGGSPEYLINTNLLGTVNCLEWARKSQTRIIFLSTSRVYPIAALNDAKFHEEETRFSWLDKQVLPGISKRGITEAFPLDGVRSLYGMTKLASEMLLEEYAYAYGVENIINRCGVLAGPWQMGKADQGVITFWIVQHLLDRPLRYIGYGGTGKQVRDFLHIDDLADLIIEQINNFDNFKGETFNVGGGIDYSLSLCELTALCQESCGQSVPIVSEPNTRTADIRIYLSNCNKLYSKCKWRPKLTALQTVEDITYWVRDNSEKLKDIFGDE